LDPRGARKDTRERARTARATTPLDPRGARKDTRERARTARGTTPLDSRGAPGQPVRRRIRDDARDGLAAAAVSLGGSITLTVALALLLRWLG
jgi:hypothetical protein